MESSQAVPTTQQDRLKAVADEQAAHLLSLKEKLNQIDQLRSKYPKSTKRHAVKKRSLVLLLSWENER